MAAKTQIYVDPLQGSDHEGAAFVDGAFANATNTLTKVGAFAAAAAGDRFFLSDNGSGEVTALMYEVASVTDNDNVVMTADIRSGAPDPTDVVLAQGTGAIGATYASLQHALDNTTHDASNGDQFNIKSDQAVGVTTTTDDVLAATLNFTSHGSPSDGEPDVIRGYASAADDGGIGGLDGDGANITISDTEFVSWVDMHVHNNGTATMFSYSTPAFFLRCELNNCDGLCIGSSNTIQIINCHLHDISGVGIDGGAGTLVYGCYFKNGTKDFDKAIMLDGAGAIAANNILSLDGASHGIVFDSARMRIIGNSVLSNAGAGVGIGDFATGNASWTDQTVMNNLVEGFSGGGGVGIKLGTSSHWNFAANNAVFNCTTKYSPDPLADLVEVLDSEEPASTLFAKSGADTFANRFAYFAPADVDSVQGGGYPDGMLVDKGAVQHADPTSGPPLIQTRRNTLIGR